MIVAGMPVTGDFSCQERAQAIYPPSLVHDFLTPTVAYDSEATVAFAASPSQLYFKAYTIYTIFTRFFDRGLRSKSESTVLQDFQVDMMTPTG